MGESLTCTCLLSIHGTLGEYDVNIKTHQEHLEENLEHVGIFMIACHSHKLTLFCKEYMYVEEKSFGLFFFFQRRNQHQQQNSILINTTYLVFKTILLMPKTKYDASACS